MLRKYLFFDLDGTLTDPMEGITRSVQYALRHFGIEVNDLKELCPFIGPPLAESFRDRYGMNEAETATAIARMREYFAPKGIFENKLYPGIPELLAATAAAGCVNVMATSKPEPFARRIAEHFDIARHFRLIAGSGLDGSRTTKVEVIRHALTQLGIVPEEAVMIGDRRHDIRCQGRRPRFHRRELGLRRTRRAGSRASRPHRRGCRRPAPSAALNAPNSFLSARNAESHSSVGARTGR